MIAKFLEIFTDLFIDMAFYLMLGITLVGIFNLIINKDTIAKQLGRNSFWSSVKACALGVPLPLCSCSVVPTGLYLKDKGASTATTTAFLISTPQTGVDSIVATYGMMGATFAWFRPLAAFISGVVGGFFVGLFDKEKKNNIKEIKNSNEEHFECTSGTCSVHEEIQKSDPILKKITSTIRYAYIETVGDIAVHFFIGLVIAALITLFLPTDLIMRANLSSGIWAMILMIIIGLPMYICSTASIPIAVSFILKGISPGAAFVFLFMGPFTNAASLSILAKKLGKKIVSLYVAVTAVLAVLFGLLLDFLLNNTMLEISISQMSEHAHETASIFQIIIAIIFALLLLYTIGTRVINKLRAKKANKNNTYASDGKSYNIYGMTCNGCSSHLQALFLKNENIKNAVVDHETNSALIYGDASEDEIRAIVENAGYSLVKGK